MYYLAFHRRQISALAAGVRDGIIREGDFALIQVTLELILAMLEETQSP